MFVSNGINLYNFWWMASPENKNIEALFDMTEGNTNFAIMKQGYAFAHFSRFIRPGYRRVEVSNPFPEHDPELPLTENDLKNNLKLGLSAWTPPYGNGLTLVAVNDSDQSVVIEVALQNIAPSLTGFHAWRTSDSEDLAPAGSVAVEDGAVHLSLPANSITTYVGLDEAESFFTWAAAEGLRSDGTGTGAPSSTAAGSSLPNLLKYALGLSASANSLSGHLRATEWTAPDDATYFGLEATLPDPAPGDVNYLPFGSSNLMDWDDPLVEANRVHHPDGTQTIIWRNVVETQSALRSFLRLEVEMMNP